MTKIIKLDDALSNKIAAGEVVERPASIVKELVENAIDAGSTTILVEIEEGGLSQIRVVDNGEGMVEEDVETAFFRHATSKIKSDRDLFHISTLGFRGEALPSIASVSYVTLTTATGDGKGTEIVIHGGKVIEKKAAHARKGTEIVVTNLFYNTPARLKYVKTVHTEAGNISDIINRLAMAHPEVSFEYYHDSKEVLKTAGNGDLAQVVASIYGRNVAKHMVEIEGTSLDYQISGLMAKPEITRASRQYMSLFVNGRYIRNYSLARAVQEGFHTLLPIGRYPIGVMSITMDPQLIDVNVHPAKLEVRLSKEEELAQLITSSIKQAFKKETLIPEADPKKQTLFNSKRDEQISFSFEEPKKHAAFQVKEHREFEQESVESLIDFTPVQEQPEAKKTGEKQSPLEETIEQSEHVEQPNETERVPTLYPIGQMHGTYIVAHNETGMYIIDQHAAQERIKYEFFREKVAEVQPHVQELLVPITFEFTSQEMGIISEHIDQLEAVGVFLEPFGHQAFIVRSHPNWLPKGHEEETIQEIIYYLLAHRRIDLAKLREEAAIMMSCKASIKANRHLRQDEMFALLESLRQSSDPFTCPHGRPIIVHFSTYSLEKMFKRVM
ncbi:DNA mismatch repair endonuclease MutL [Bacillus suaedae]|uniref:DNA mismatch repair protein MutL n=1 Tax=Halalkalibacter suaedae TaxID=2822140 RepID=A0A941ANR9_9BACI|nr:DNA mismatch repair endonuclease MutL [Bacillus suaedae]MBP3951955.1 DNA mismatch repair endonuclease MutL [Bacillus suaedae]